MCQSAHQHVDFNSIKKKIMVYLHRKTEPYLQHATHLSLSSLQKR